MTDFYLPIIGEDLGFAWDELVYRTSASPETQVFPPGGAFRAAGQVHGKVEVTCELGRDLGEHKTSGKDGHRVVDKGLEPAKVKIKLTAWSRAGMDALQALGPILDPRKRLKDRSPIEVHYPSLAQLGITQVIIKKVTGLQPTGTNGMFSMELDCIEYTPPAKRKPNVTQTVQTQTFQPPALFDPNRGTTNVSDSAFNRTPADGVAP